MRADDVRELLGAWAVDAVDAEERAAVEHAIAADLELAAEARALHEVTARLAEDAGTPPPAELRDRTLEVIAVTEQEPTKTAGPRRPQPLAAPGAAEAGPATGAGGLAAPPDVTEAAPKHRAPGPSGQDAPGSTGADDREADDRDADDRDADDRDADVVSLASRRARRRDRWVAAAAIVVAAAVPGAIAFQQSQRAEQAEQQVATIAEALTQPGAELVAEEVAGGGRAVAVITEETALFTAQGLSELPAEEDYQLWVIEDAGITSAGVLSLADGRVSTQVSDLPAGALIAMTVEPAGGSPQPTTDPIVALPAP